MTRWLWLLIAGLWFGAAIGWAVVGEVGITIVACLGGFVFTWIWWTYARAFE